MRTIKSLCWLIALAILPGTQTGCKKDKVQEEKSNEKPGHIPGMGNEPGAPAGEQFKLPKGISIVGEIKGAEYWNSTPNGCGYDGSGKDVIVKIILQRDSIGGPPTVEFPPGLIITSTSEGFQSGLLVERVVVPLPPREPGSGPPKCTVTLFLSCLNKSKNRSEDHAVYKFGPVTSSPLIKDLLKRLAVKKTLLSQYPSKAEWEKTAEVVQDALWSLTEYEGLTQDDLQYIAELPNK